MLAQLPIWLQAGIWGLFGASSLIMGAAVAYLARLGTTLIAAIMSFGCGVLISAVAYDLIFDGFRAAGMSPVISGAVTGSVAYALANWAVSRNGARHRKRSNNKQTHVQQGGGLAIAIGSMLDGIPESVVLGVSLLGGGTVSLPVFAAVFLSNFPEGLSSASGMKKAGRSKLYVFGLWAGITVLSGLAALLGAAFLGGAPPAVLAVVQAIAAGALLTMVADTMIPEAVEGEHGAAGLLVVLGLLLAFFLSHRS
jgi:zinc transporter, ZIP family